VSQRLRFAIAQIAALNDVIDGREWLLHSLFFEALAGFFAQTGDVA
jgi:hypothetical protein